MEVLDFRELSSNGKCFMSTDMTTILSVYQFTFNRKNKAVLRRT